VLPIALPRNSAKKCNKRLLNAGQACFQARGMFWRLRKSLASKGVNNNCGAAGHWKCRAHPAAHSFKASGPTNAKPRPCRSSCVRKASAARSSGNTSVNWAQHGQRAESERCPANRSGLPEGQPVIERRAAISKRPALRAADPGADEDEFPADAQAARTAFTAFSAGEPSTE